MQIRRADASNRASLIERLRREPARHAVVLQDLLLWFEESRFHFVETPAGLSYLHVSGHPAHQRRHPVIILDGEPAEVEALLRFVAPPAPFVVRETSDLHTSALREYFPEARFYFEQRMDLAKERFRPAHRGFAREMTPEDAPALARFMGAPPAAAPALLGWIQGAEAFLGVFENDALIAVGSSFVTLPEVWTLIGIETHPRSRGRGFATEITSNLVEIALRETPLVSLTAVSDNVPAVKIYERLGFQRTQGRLWADCGAGSAPDASSSPAPAAPPAPPES